MSGLSGYDWHRRYRSGGAAALRSMGRPSNGASAFAAPSPPLPPSSPGAGQRRIEELERKIGQQQLDLDFFRAAYKASGSSPEEGRTWRDSVFAVIRAETERQGDNPGIERMCSLAGVSRASYYRHWLASRPREEETALRDAIQRSSLVRRKRLSETAIG